jgi:MFS transporter, DHA2 family, multidrug resistance protein
VTSHLTENSPQLKHASTAGRREWIGLSVLALPCLLYSMDLTVLNLALPALSRDLAPSSTQLLWIVDIYGFLLAGFLIPMGTVGDRIGRRRLLLIGAGVFGATSMLAAFSTSAAMLIVARAALGITGATLAPSTLSLIRHMFLDPGQRTFAIGIWIMSFSAGAAIGPLVGGALLEHFWWGSAFLVGVPVMVLLLAVGPVLLPEYRDPRAGRLDWLSAALSMATVLAIIYGIKQIAVEADALWWALPMMAGAATGVVFVRRQRTLMDPLIDLQLFRVRAFSAALATNGLGFFVNFAALLFIAQYLQLVLGFSPWQAGLWTLPSSGGFVVGSLIVPAIVRHARPAFVMSGGLVLTAVGFLTLAQVQDGGLAALVTGSVLFSLGLAPVFTLATDMTVGAAPPERAGAAAAVSETSAELGGALGIAILGSIGTAVYRRVMAGTDIPALSPEAGKAVRDTLSGAIAAAERLPEHIGVELVGAAREAFVAGFEVATGVSAVIAMVLAVLAGVVLRHVRTGADVSTQERDDVGQVVEQFSIVSLDVTAGQGVSRMHHFAAAHKRSSKNTITRLPWNAEGAWRGV